uniref:Uncharacterized protein n=1 Tax=Leersia perrieri TaxID=77586 RepID=A0A0D9WXF1_9ORYZ
MNQRRGVVAAGASHRARSWGLVPCCSHLPKPKLRYLYLVLDDWERGYSIHRVGDDDFDSNAGGLSTRLTKCLLIRIQAQHASNRCFIAHGTKILGMNPAGFSPGIPVFDTETIELTVYPSPKCRSIISGYALVNASVGERLMLFAHHYLQVLGPEPPPTDVDAESSWSWTTMEPSPPFDSSYVSGYALHPDGRTIFMSINNWKTVKSGHLDVRNCTFSFDTERLEWTHRDGQAHYDRELDTWVGLSRFKEGVGHLCCCDVPPVAAGCSNTLPAWKLCKEELFNNDLTSSSGLTLVYMGDSRFCLIESRLPKDCDFRTYLRAVTITCGHLLWSQV